MNTLARLDPGADGWFLVLLGASALAAVVSAAGLLGRILARRDPATSHAIDRAALLLILALPVLVPLAGRSQWFAVTWPRPEARRPEPPQAPPPQPALPLPRLSVVERVEEEPAPLPAVAMPEPVVAEPRILAPVEAAPVEPAFEFDRASLCGLAVAAWLTVAGMLALRLIHGLMGLQRLRRLARPADPAALAELRNAFGPDAKLPPIFEVPGLPGPLAGGPIYPAIYLPEGLPASLDPDALREILIHECAHAFRRDPLFGLLQRIATALFWPHPAIHLLNRRLSRSREAVCDNHVLGRSRRTSYARTLLALAERQSPPRTRHLAVVGLWEALEPLETRVRDILDERRPPVTRPSPLRTLSATLVVTLLALPLAGLRFLPPAQASEASPEPASTSPEAASVDPVELPSPPADEPPFPFDPTFGDKTVTVIEGTTVDDEKTLSGIRVNGTWLRKQPEPAVSGAYGRFTLRMVGPPRRVENIIATNADGTIQGYATSPLRVLTSHMPVEINMKPARKIAVLVKDGTGKPVPSAHVTVHADGPLAEQISDAEGRARLLVPADARISAVVAHKDRVGMDYFLVDPYYFNTGPSEIPESITLRLLGAQSASVRVVDEKKEPRAGFRVHLHGISLRGKSRPLNIAATESMTAATDAQGIAHFHWLPREIRSQPRVVIFPWEGQELQPVHLEPGSKSPVEYRVTSHVTFSGKVIQTDGKPLRRALVGFQAFPDRGDYSEGWTRTDSEGIYRFKVPPRRTISIALLEGGRAAAPIFGIYSERGIDREGLDLRVVEGGIIGAGIVGPDGKPRAGAHLRLTMLGPPQPRNNDIRLNGGDRESFTTYAYPGLSGSLNILLAPGDYRISAGTDDMHSEQVNVTVTPATKQVRHFKLVVDETDPEWKPVTISGTAFDATGQAQPQVPGAIITALPFGREMVTPPEGTADENGLFRFDVPAEVKVIRRPSRMVVFSPGGPNPKALVIARNAEGTLAGSVRINDGSKDLRIPMSPAGILTGRLLKSDGSPDVGRDMILIQVTSGTRQSVATYRTEAVTDGQGKYRFTGVLVDTRCTVFAIPRGESMRGLMRPSKEAYKEVTVERGGVIDLGTFQSETVRSNPERPKARPIGRRDEAAGTPRSPTERSGLSAMPFATTPEAILACLSSLSSI